MSILHFHALATLYMVGVVWFVQVVHYPLFQRIPAGEFAAYERLHTRLTTWVVMPPMILELATAIWLVLDSNRVVSANLAFAGLALVALIWLSTFAIQVPCHARLERNYDEAVARRLVSTNWIRTVAWSLRGLIALAMLVPSTI